jgi:membrane-associated protein
MFDVVNIIESGGLLLIGLIVFAETGLLIGFFLPGDTLLLTAGVFAAQGKLPIGLTLVVVILASIVGNLVGYHIGHKTGHRIFRKKDGILFRKEYLIQAETFYEKHGNKTILFARFIPIIRTFAALVAGIGKMPMKRFMFYNVLGGIVWGGSVTLLGYWFGSRIPNIDTYLLPAVLLAMLATFSPVIWHLLKEKETRRALKQSITNLLSGKKAD